MTENEPCIKVDCSGEIGLARAEEIHTALSTALADGRPIQLDCSAITLADFSFIQLVIAARSSALRRGVPFTLKRPVGEPLLSALQRGGFLAQTPLSTNQFWLGES